jgi:hypothetical protein
VSAATATWVSAKLPVVAPFGATIVTVALDGDALCDELELGVTTADGVIVVGVTDVGEPPAPLLHAAVASSTTPSTTARVAFLIRSMPLPSGSRTLRTRPALAR